LSRSFQFTVDSYQEGYLVKIQKDEAILKVEKLIEELDTPFVIINAAYVEAGSYRNNYWLVSFEFTAEKYQYMDSSGIATVDDETGIATFKTTL
jgi:hypothetical protein